MQQEEDDAEAGAGDQRADAATAARCAGRCRPPSLATSPTAGGARTTPASAGAVTTSPRANPATTGTAAAHTAVTGATTLIAPSASAR